ncbi:MAG TPA: EamA family transporter, partial [Candidatus Deferrimicrobium sp.]|nr:EamA family transporter [Candidatus Deferrimicrobium sp.]
FSFTTPLTATFVSLAIHSVILWIAVFVTGGIPPVATGAIVAIAITGLLQPAIRHFHYTGIHKIGTSRAVTLRNSYPFLTVIAGIVFLGEPLTLLGMAGTLLVVAGIILTSWRMDRNLPSFRWVYLFYPIATVLLTTIVHPLRRYALIQSHEPLLLAALVGPIALISFAAFYASPACTDKLVWDRRASWPLVLSGIFETLAVLFMLIAFASGPVYIVSPISATVPIWTMMIGAVFLREVERINLATIVGTILVVAGVIVISRVE